MPQCPGEEEEEEEGKEEVRKEGELLLVVGKEGLSHVMMEASARNCWVA